MTRFCRDCKWCQPSRFGTDFDICTRPTYRRPSDGKPIPDKHGITFCTILREDGWLIALLMRTCGRCGWWFEKIEKPHIIDGEHTVIDITTATVQKRLPR